MKVKTLRPRREQHYMFEIVAPNNIYYNRLKELYEQYPELTYDNKGYDKPYWLKESHPEQLKEIHEILSNSLLDFREFNHFVVNKEGEIGIRVQYMWSPMFKGVGYFDLDFWNEEYHHNAAIETGIIDEE